MCSFLPSVRRQPHNSRRHRESLPKITELCRRMPKIWIVVYLINVFATSMASSQIIQGSIAECDREGEEIFIPGISTDPCISCLCSNHEVRCERRTCHKSVGCHVIPFDKPDNQCCETCQGCEYRGKSFLSATQWSDSRDPCRILTCQAGVLTISRRRCHVTCQNPRIVLGQCCPLCDGCHVNGVTYHENQTFPSPMDPCVTCKCHNGTTSCQKELCPVLNCPATHQHTPVGSCCPQCRGTRHVYLPPGGSCLFRRGVHGPGSDVTLDKCTQCKCSGGTLQCDRTSCPVLDCATDTHIQEPGTCCPRCDVTKRRCKLYGKKYSHGHVWKRDLCTHCYCSDGVVRCQAESCSNDIECPNNTRLKMQQGQCCPQCVDDGALCTVFGDPHYRSFDGRIYNFQGTCDYILSETCQTADFSVIVRNDARLTDMYAWTKTVRIRVGGASVYFLQKTRVKVNKKPAVLPYVHRRGRFSIVRSGRTVALKMSSGVKITWDGDSYLEVFVPPQLKHQMCGLCGNYNNDKADDFLGQDGVLHLAADDFGRSWQAPGKRCHDNSVVPANPRESPCVFEPLKFLEAQMQCGEFYKPEFAKCQLKGDVHSYYASCLTDVCECPDYKNCFCESYIAFTRACAQEGVDLQSELPDVCKDLYCPTGAFWSECASACPKTCDDMGERACAEPCIPGCECPRNKVLHNNRCVRTSRCGSSNSVHKSEEEKRKRRKRKRKKWKSPLDYLTED